MRNKFVRIGLVGFILTNLVFISCPNFVYELKLSIVIDTLCEGRFDKVNTCQGMCLMKKANDQTQPLASLLKPMGFEALIQSIDDELSEAFYSLSCKIYSKFNLSHIPVLFYDVKTPPPRA